MASVALAPRRRASTRPTTSSGCAASGLSDHPRCSALIAQLDTNDVHHERTRQLLLDFPEERLAASVITLVEAFVAPARADRLDEAQALLRELGLAPIGLSADAVSRLAVLRAETGLRMSDCCVLLTAGVAGAETIAPFDEQLARVSAARGLNIPGSDRASAGDESVG